MKKLLENLDSQRKFLKLYYDKEIKHIDISRILKTDELKDFSQAMKVSESITHFSYHQSDPKIANEASQLSNSSAENAWSRINLHHT